MSSQVAEHRGTLDVRTVAVEHLVEHIAAQVPGSVGSRSGLDRLRGRGYPRAQASVRGSSSWIRLEIAVVWPSSIEQIATVTRERVRSEAARMTGSDVRRVDVTVHVLTADQADTHPRRVQ